MPTNADDLLQRAPSRALGRWRRRYDARRWPLLAEALVLLAFSSAAIRLLPFRRVVKLADRRGSARGSRGAGDQAPALVAAVEALARRAPWRTVCFQKGLAVHLMLRRRGIASVLHYGVRRADAHELAAHVWVSIDGEAVIGGEVADQFHCLATYPALG